METQTEKPKFKFNCLSSDKNADEVAKELLRIQKKHGELKPIHIVNEAKNPKSIFHNFFTWDINKAAKKCWLIEAQEIIRKLLIANEIDGKIVYSRAFINLQRDENNNLTFNPFEAEESTYLNIGDILQNSKFREYALERAFRELDAFQRKYSQFDELCLVMEAINKIKRKSNFN